VGKTNPIEQFFCDSEHLTANFDAEERGGLLEAISEDPPESILIDGDLYHRESRKTWLLTLRKKHFCSFNAYEWER